MFFFIWCLDYGIGMVPTYHLHSLSQGFNLLFLNVLFACCIGIVEVL